MKKDKNIDELFREKLEHFAQEPPAYLLENILAGAAAARRRKKIVFWRVAGVAAALLIAFIAGWQMEYLNNANSDRKNEFAQSQIDQTEQETEIQNSEIITENNVGILKQVEEELKDLKTDLKTRTAIEKPIQERRIKIDKTENIMPEERPGLEKIESLDKVSVTAPKIELALKEMKKPVSTQEPEGLTIDQQIMRQNQELILAENSVNQKARWIVGAQISPVYSNSKSNQTAVYANNMLNSSTNNPVDLGGGISVEVKTGKRWSVQSGIYYSALGQSSGNSSYGVQKDNSFADAGHASDYFNTNVSIESGSNKMLMNSSAGVIEFSGIPSGIEIAANPEESKMSTAAVVSDARFVQNFEYIEIPLYLRYTLVDSRFNMEMLGGFSSNFLVGNQTFMESDGKNNLIGKTQNMETINYSGTIGLGLKYGLSKHLFLNVEPRVKYYLNSLNNSSEVTYKPYTIGVFSGLSYEF
jgi:hypothetical protein